MKSGEGKMRPILMGMTVYGEHYRNLFLNYCLPSLMAPGNLPALCKEREVILLIHTDLIGYESLNYKITPPPGVDIRLTTDVIAEEKYHQLGRHQNKDLLQAKEIGADYHCLMPDFVYSENFFASVLRAVEQGHKTIARLVLSTTMETVCPLLEPYRRDSVIAIPAADLATLGLTHIHRGCRHWLAAKEGYPNSHVIVWEGKNTLHMLSPHCTPIYMANEVIHPGDSSGKPLDNILDKITTGDIYCPKPGDEMVMIEITPEANRMPDDKRGDINEFRRMFRANTDNSMRQWQIFNEETIDPINRHLLSGGYMNDMEIAARKQTIKEELRNA